MHPGDQYALDLFAQIGQALRSPGQPALGGLRARHVAATGESQSAFYLTAFADALQPRTKTTYPAPADLAPPGEACAKSSRGRYDRIVLGLLMVLVVGGVWFRRRWVVRKERARAAEWARAEAEALVREQEIIEDLEARFQQ